MPKKILSTFSLVLLEIIIVGNLQVLPANAVNGFSLPFLYGIALITFFIPCLMMVSTLATRYPQTGGAYIWCQLAFSKRIGFGIVTMLWFANLLWYPSIFALIATNFAYIINPALAHQKTFIMLFSIGLFWFITTINYKGLAFSSHFSMLCSIIGVILPMILIIAAGIWWLDSDKPLAINLTTSPLFPDVSHLSHIGLFISIIISLFGMELTAVHAGDTENPKTVYPKSLIISGLILIFLLIGSELSVGVIVPPEKLNIMTGMLDAFITFFKQIHWEKWTIVMLSLVLMGYLGSVAAWMMSSTRSMFIACKKNHVSSFLQKTNKIDAPTGVLFIEATIFTFISIVFAIFPNVTDSFWLLLVLASQISLMYYAILFISAIKLERSEGKKSSLLFHMMMIMGTVTCFAGLLIGFIPPESIQGSHILIYHGVMIFGLIFSVLLPYLLLQSPKDSKLILSS